MTDEQTPTEEPKLVILSGREYPELVKAMQLRQAAFIIRDFITWMKVQKGNEIQLKTDDGAQVPLQVFIPEEDKIPIEQHTPSDSRMLLMTFCVSSTYLIKSG